ncbi:MAG: hypothetical protein WCR74_19675 [Betaproteobacteria bacterium]
MLRWMLMLVLAAGGGAALAQKTMYRCGNVFQERPCEGPKTEAAQPAAKPAVTSTSAPQKSQADKDRAAQQARCDNWTSDMDDVQKRIKVGPTGQAAKDLESRRIELDKQIKKGCAS